jgi:hypothetical protein
MRMMTKFSTVLLGSVIALAMTVPVVVAVAVVDSGGGVDRHPESGMMSDAGTMKGRHMDAADREAHRAEMQQQRGDMGGTGSGMRRGAATSRAT